MDFCQNSGKCLFWDFCQKLIFIKETIARNEFWQMSQSIYWVLANVPVVISSSGKCPSWYIKFWQMSQLLYWVLANVPVVISSSGKCPSWYIKFWQMSQLLHYDLANVPVNIFCSGKCSPPPPLHPVLPHLTKPHPTPTHPTVTLVSKEQPNKLFFSMTYILSSGKFLSSYFDSWKISQMANFPPGQYFHGWADPEFRYLHKKTV